MEEEKEKEMEEEKEEERASGDCLSLKPLAYIQAHTMYARVCVRVCVCARVFRLQAPPLRFEHSTPPPCSLTVVLLCMLSLCEQINTAIT